MNDSRVRAWLMVAVFTAVSLAGCTDVAAPRPGDGANASGGSNALNGTGKNSTNPESVRLPTDVRGVDCGGAHLAFLVPADRAQDALPSGLHAAGAPHDSLAQIQLRHAQCSRLVLDNATEFPDYREVQLWIHVNPPEEMRPPAGWLSYFVVRVWQTGAPMSLFEQRGLPAAAGDYSQTTQTIVPDAWSYTAGDFEPADEQEAWSFEILSDDLPVPRTEQYRAFYGDDLRFYDLLVEGRIANQDYGGVLLADEGSTLASLSGTGSANVELGGVFVETVLAGNFEVG